MIYLLLLGKEFGFKAIADLLELGEEGGIAGIDHVGYEVAEPEGVVGTEGYGVSSMAWCVALGLLRHGAIDWGVGDHVGVVVAKP